MNNIVAVALVVIKELYRRKDVYVLFILTALITLMAGAVNLFNDPHIVRYVKELCLLLIWIAMLVIAITMAARHIPMERESRTIFPLLAKPISRAEVLLGKFLGCWLACGLALLVFYVFFGAVCLAREHDWQCMNYVQALLLHWAMLAIVLAATLLGSLVFAAPGSNTTILLVVTSGILLVGRHLHKVALQLPEPQQTVVTALYYLIPHLEWYDVRDLIIHNWPLIPWPVVTQALFYAACYSALFLIIACRRFRKLALT